MDAHLLLPVRRLLRFPCGAAIIVSLLLPRGSQDTPV